MLPISRSYCEDEMNQYLQKFKTLPCILKEVSHHKEMIKA